MSNASLSITATITGGSMTKDIELQQAKRVCELALQAARSAGGATTSGTVTEPGTTASATWSYTAVATK